MHEIPQCEPETPFPSSKDATQRHGTITYVWIVPARLFLSLHSCLLSVICLLADEEMPQVPDNFIEGFLYFKNIRRSLIKI